MQRMLTLRGYAWVVYGWIVLTYAYFGYGQEDSTTALSVFGISGVCLGYFWSQVYVLRQWLCVTVLSCWALGNLPPMIGGTDIVTALAGLLALGWEYIVGYKDARAQSYPSRKRPNSDMYGSAPSLSDSPRFLVVTASDGGGHMTAARYWTARLQAEGKNVETIDILPLASIGTQRFFRWWPYIAMYIPEVHAFMHLFARSDLGVKWLKPFAIQLATKLAATVETPTDVIVCHPLGAASVNYLRRGAWSRVRVTVVQTDFFINPHGWNPLNHEYHLPCSLTPRLRSLPSVRTKLDLVWDLPLVLVTVGNGGFLPPEKMFKLVRSLDRISKTLNVQFVCAAGTNRTLKAEVKKLQNKHVKVLPEQEDLASLMPQFDAVLIKAGGMTCVESLAAKVPFAIWYRWRGQEAINTSVLKKNNLTIYVGDSERKISRWLITALGLQTTR